MNFDALTKNLLRHFVHVSHISLRHSPWSCSPQCEIRLEAKPKSECHWNWHQYRTVNQPKQRTRSVSARWSEKNFLRFYSYFVAADSGVTAKWLFFLRRGWDGTVRRYSITKPVNVSFGIEGTMTFLGRKIKRKLFKIHQKLFKNTSMQNEKLSSVYHFTFSFIVQLQVRLCHFCCSPTETEMCFEGKIEVKRRWFRVQTHCKTRDNMNIRVCSLLL